MKRIILILTLLITLNACVKKNDTFNLSTKSTNVVPYQLVIVSSSDVSFDKDTYQGFFDDKEITLVKNNEGDLIFSIPDLAKKTYELKLNINDQEGSLSFNVNNNTIEDIDATIDEKFLEPLELINENITEFIANGNLTPETNKMLASAHLMYSNFINQYNNISYDEKLAIAKFFNANPIFTSDFTTAMNKNASGNGINSNTSFSCFMNNSVQLLIISGAFVSWVNVVGPYIIGITGPIGLAVVGVATLVGTYVAIAEMEARIEKIREVCLLPTSSYLEDNSGNINDFSLSNSSYTVFDLKTSIRKAISSDINNVNIVISKPAEAIEYVVEKWGYVSSTINPIINTATSWFSNWFSSSSTYEPISTSIEPLSQASSTIETDGDNDFVSFEGIPSDVSADIQNSGTNGYNIKFDAANSTLPRSFPVTIKYDDGDFTTSDVINVNLEDGNQIDLNGSWQGSGPLCIPSGGGAANYGPSHSSAIFNTSNNTVKFIFSSAGVSMTVPYTLVNNDISFSGLKTVYTHSNVTCSDGTFISSRTLYYDFNFSGTITGNTIVGTYNFDSYDTPYCFAHSNFYCSDQMTFTN